MKVGMLWFDDSSKTMEQKVQRAAKHYEQKYGRAPNLCLVHSGSATVGEIEVRPGRSILPHHFWLGVADN